MGLLLPESLVRRFLKSATLGHQFSPRKIRLLTIGLFALWIVCLLGVCFKAYTGLKATIEGYDLKNGMIQDASGKSVSKDVFYLDTGRYKSEILLNKGRRDLIYFLPAFILIGFILPWLIPRLIYWVKNADKLQA